MEMTYYIETHYEMGSGRREQRGDFPTLAEAMASVADQMPSAPPEVRAIDVREKRLTPPPPGPQNPPGADIALRVERTNGGPWRVSHRTRFVA